MKIAVIGSGALGSLFAARLTPLADVTMLGHWPEQIAAIRRHGLTVVEADGRRTNVPLQIVTEPGAAAPVGIALVLVKSGQTARAAADSAALLAGAGCAVTLQNGLGNADTLAEVLGQERVVQGSTAQGAALEAPGIVRHAGGGMTYLGNDAGGTAVSRLAALLNQAGIPTALTNNVTGLIWGKLAINAAINPLTALLGRPNGALLEAAWSRRLVTAVAREVEAVARRLDITLPYPDAADAALEVAAATAGNRSSMLQDIARGVETEIAAICGAVVAAGARASIDTPLNEQLLEMVRRRERGEMFSAAAVRRYLKNVAA